VTPFVSFGLDVTMRCQIPATECIPRFKTIGGPLEVVSAMTEVWAHSASLVTFHDPLAGACVFEPNLCSYQEGLVEIEIKSDHVPGMTHFRPKSPEKPHSVAVDVQVDAFFQHYFSIVDPKKG
jgi:purine nucleosidase